MAAELLAEEGVEAASNGDYEEAVLAFERSLTIDEDAVTLCNLGVAYERLGRVEEAIKAYERCSAVEPEDCVPLVNRADALVRTGRLQLATRVYVQALSLDDGPSEPWAVVNNLGVAYERLGEVDNAVLAYREAARLHPRYALPRENLKRLAHGPKALDAAVLSRTAEDADDKQPALSLFDQWFPCTGCICSPMSPDQDSSRSMPVCCSEVDESIEIDGFEHCEELDTCASATRVAEARSTTPPPPPRSASPAALTTAPGGCPWPDDSDAPPVPA